MRTLEEIKAYHDKWSEGQIVGIMGKQYLVDMATLFSILNGTGYASEIFGIKRRYMHHACNVTQTIHSIDFLSNMHYLLKLIENK